MTTTRIPIPYEQIGEFCRKWQITELSLFGSVLRDDFRPDSDIDVLVTFEPTAQWSLSRWMAMRDELADLLGRPVDLVERGAIEESQNPFRRRHILTNAQPIYVA